MIKTDENLNISVESRLICTKPFLGGGVHQTLVMPNLALKSFYQLSNFSFLGVGVYIKLWSCQICHKHFSPDFQFLIRGGGATLVMPNLP